MSHAGSAFGGGGGLLRHGSVARVCPGGGACRRGWRRDVRAYITMQLVMFSNQCMRWSWRDSHRSATSPTHKVPGVVPPLCTQVPDADKRQRATYIIDTGTSLEETRQAVEALIQSLKARPGGGAWAKL